jgi:NADH:ubiquinone oxidoreductase subunit 4 (subunit M)
MIIALLVIGLVCCISSDDQLLGLIGVVRAVLIYTNSVLVFVVLFELVLIPIVGYIILYRKSEYRIFSAVVILFYGVVSGFPLIALILRVSESAGSLEFTIMEANSLIVVFLFPFLVKLPVFGCHH